MNPDDLSKSRIEYRGDEFDGEIMSASNPIEILVEWVNEAKQRSPESDATAMNLCTVDDVGAPDCRMVLCKGINVEQGTLVFFTNLESAKAVQIENCSKVALSFWWPVLQRQIRLRGTASALPKEQAVEYFSTRPRGAQISAHASKQSREASIREDLQQRVRYFEDQFAGFESVPMPTHWGGFEVAVQSVELWLGGSNRLHDRVLFTREESSIVWRRTRLYP